MRELIEKANAEIKRVKDYIEEHEEMFDYMDLKLHNAQGYQWGDMKKDFPLCYADDAGRIEDSYFYRFCDVSYDQFTDWCAEEGIDFNKMRKPLGRTSSFYLTDLADRTSHRINWTTTIYTIIEMACGYYVTDYFSLGIDGFIMENSIDLNCSAYYTEKEMREEVIGDLEYIIENLWKEFQKEIEDVEKVYSYIEDFKENQVQYFKEYLQWNEEDLRDAKEQEEKEESKRLEIISKMPEIMQPIMKRCVYDKEDLEIILGCVTK